MRLKRLKISNFRGFHEAEFEFQSSGFVLIKGESGAGKSSVLLAISWVLDILPDGFSGAKLQNWDATGAMQVQLELDTDSGPIILCRGKNTSITTPTEAITGAKAYSEALPRILGMSSSILSAMVYRPQRKPGMFVSMRPAEKSEFIVEALGYQKIETEIEKSKAKQSALQKSLDTLEGSIRTLAGFANEQLTPPKILNEEMLRDEVSEASQLSDDAALRLTSLSEEIEETKKKVQQDKEDEKKQAALNIVKVKETIESLRTKEILANCELVELGKVHEFKIGLKNLVRQRTTEVAVLESQLTSLNSNKCAMCGQAWHDNESSKDQLLQKIQQVKSEISVHTLNFDTEEVMSQKSVVISKILEIKKSIAKGEAVVDKLVGDLTKLMSVEIPQEIKDKLQKLKSEDSSAREKYLKAKQELSSAEMTNKFAQQNYEAAVSRIAENKKALNNQNAEFKKTDEEMRIERDFCHIVGKDGFLSLFFEDVLADISVRANGMLRLLPNVIGVSINFAPETSKTGSKKSIGLEVTVDGKNADFESGLSGGQQAVVEQVVDIALAQVLQDRTGKTPMFLMLDETLYGFGNQTKEAILEVLARFANDKLVLVVDHSSEVKEMFSEVIDIRRKDGVSYVNDR